MSIHQIAVPQPALAPAVFSNAERADFGALSSWAELDAAQRDQPGSVRVAVLALGGPQLRPDADAELILRVLAWFGRADVVSIAVMSGVIDAGDLALALACDLRLAAADLSVEAGSTVQPGLVGPLVEAVGRGPAAALLLADQSLSAADSMRIGLLTHLLAEGDDAVSRLVDKVLRHPRDLTIERKALVLAARPAAAGAAVSAAEVAARDRLARDAAGSAG